MLLSNVLLDLTDELDVFSHISIKFSIFQHPTTPTPFHLLQSPFY